MDVGRAAAGGVGALDERAELAFVHARPGAVAQRDDRRVGELAADPQPVDLLGGLDEAQPRVRGVERDDLGHGRSASRACAACPSGPISPTRRSRGAPRAQRLDRRRDPEGAAGRTSASVAIRAAFGTWL